MVKQLSVWWPQIVHISCCSGEFAHTYVVARLGPIRLSQVLFGLRLNFGAAIQGSTKERLANMENVA